MADTRNNVVIPAGVWTDLYALSGITTGTTVTLINKGIFGFNYVIAAVAPTDPNKGIPLESSGARGAATIPTGASGLWGYCPQEPTEALVQD